MLRKPKRINYILIPIVVVILTGILVYIFFPADPSEQDKLKFEFLKFLIQLALIGVIGSLLVHEFNRGRDREKNKNEFRKELLANLSKSYFKAKKIRRILEANIKKGNDDKLKTMSYKAYESQMKDLIEVQLEFELHQEQLEIFPWAFRNKVTNIEMIKNVLKMEKYLNLIIEEYQKSNTVNGTINIIEMKKLVEFIEDTIKFKKEFSGLYHGNVGLFQSEILDF